MSKHYDKTLAFAEGKKLLPFAFLWGFIEALFWPLIAESFLAFFVVTKPKKVMPAATALSLGSAAGVVVHSKMVEKGYSCPRPLTTRKMHTTASEQLEQEGYKAIRHQLFSGVPVKVYAHEAGMLAGRQGEQNDLKQAFVQTLLWRGLRIIGVAAVIAGLGHLCRSIIERYYSILFAAGSGVFALMLRLLVKKWK